MPREPFPTATTLPDVFSSIPSVEAICGFAMSASPMFRHPVLPVSAYLDLYSQGTSGEWTADAGRQDLAIIRSTIGQNNGPLSRA